MTLRISSSARRERGSLVSGREGRLGAEALFCHHDLGPKEAGAIETTEAGVRCGWTGLGGVVEAGSREVRIDGTRDLGFLDTRLLEVKNQRTLVVGPRTLRWDPMRMPPAMHSCGCLASLRPLYFFSSRTGQYATPAQLQQHYLRCPANAKPLAVLYLLEPWT